MYNKDLPKAGSKQIGNNAFCIGRCNPAKSNGQKLSK